MGVENGFKIREIDGKKRSRNSDMKDEIRAFSTDNKIDNKENQVLNKILDYNKMKNREKLLLQKTTRSELESLKNISGLSIQVKNKINNILSNTKSNERVSNNRYLSSNGKLKNVNPITLKILFSKNISDINNQIGDKNNFSITNKYGKIYNVFLGKKSNGETNYYYKDGPKKGKIVRIYDGYKLGKYSNISEENRNENDKQFTKRINNHNKIINYIESKDFDPNSQETKNILKAAEKYLGATERGKGPKSKKLRKEMKKFGLNLYNKKHYWCAAYIGLNLIDGKVFNNINELKRKVKNPNRAASYLGGQDFPGHISIYRGQMKIKGRKNLMDMEINGNVRNSVANSYVNWQKLVGWSLPGDVGNPSKVNIVGKPFNSKSPPISVRKKIPKGAILVFWRGKADKHQA